MSTKAIELLRKFYDEALYISECNVLTAKDFQEAAQLLKTQGD